MTSYLNERGSHRVELIRAEVSHGVLGCEYNYSPFRNKHVYTRPLFSTKAAQTLTSNLDIENPWKYIQTTGARHLICPERLDGSEQMRS